MGDLFDLQGTESCGNSCRDIQVSDGKEDHVGKGVESAESTGAVLDDFDDTVEALGNGVGQV